LSSNKDALQHIHVVRFNLNSPTPWNSFPYWNSTKPDDPPKAKSLLLIRFPRVSKAKRTSEWKAVSRHSIDWLASLDGSSVDLVFVDPPYNEGRLGQFREPRTHYRMALKLGRKPSESLELLDRAGLVEADIRTPMRKVREMEGIRGLMLNREASRCWLALAGG
jgi:hypothetical protein